MAHEHIFTILRYGRFLKYCLPAMYNYILWSYSIGNSQNNAFRLYISLPLFCFCLDPLANKSEAFFYDTTDNRKVGAGIFR